MDKKSSFSFWANDNEIICKDTMDVVLLAHVQEPRGFINKSQLQCNKTERFSIEEFREIYQGIVDAGYYIQAVYYNELDFIAAFIEHPEKFQNSMIFNLARNGIGVNKKTIIPSFCELVGLNYSTSPSLTCALCRNKYYFTTLLRKHNLPAPKSWLLSSDGTWESEIPPEGTLVICKPCSESASQGVNESAVFISTPKKYKHFLGTQCIVQKYIDGEECEVPVFKVGGAVKAYPPVGIDLGSKRILDEQSSAESLYSFYPLGDTQKPDNIKAICEYAIKAFQLMQMEVYGRIDFRIDSNGAPYIFDISTTPYTTKHSSFSFAFEHLGLSYSDIYRAIIFASLQRSELSNLK